MVQPRQPSPRSAWLLRTLALALMGLLIILAPGDAGAVPLRVRGASVIDLLASELASGVKLRGEVVDEMGASLGRVSVKLEALDRAGRPIRMDPPGPCAGATRSGG
ncbi:MAG: hypothetical protein IPG04_06610 [Polyangiaceae bacterium]|nr:hypothetical protein [Polyangiaceae bacterium]